MRHEQNGMTSLCTNGQHCWEATSTPTSLPLSLSLCCLSYISDAGPLAPSPLETHYARLLLVIMDMASGGSRTRTVNAHHWLVCHMRHGFCLAAHGTVSHEAYMHLSLSSLCSLICGDMLIKHSQHHVIIWSPIWIMSFSIFVRILHIASFSIT